MKLPATTILKATIVVIGLVVLLICATTSPALLRGDLDEFSPVLIGIYLTTIPFYYALFQAFKLLQLIDRDRAFSRAAETSLKMIARCALLVSAIYAIGLPYLFMLADEDDAPGLIVLGMAFIFAPFVIATAAAVFQKLVQNAVKLKSENDLTV